MNRCFPILLILTFPIQVSAIEEFVETFGGLGPFAASDGRFPGFDVPDWIISGSGHFQDGGFRVENELMNEFIDFDTLGRTVEGMGSFVERLEIKDPTLNVVEVGSRSISLERHFAPSLNNEDRVAIRVEAPDSFDPNPIDLYLSIVVQSTLVEFARVPTGPNLLFSIIFDDETSQVAFEYDNDVVDEVPPYAFGPFDYGGQVLESQWTKATVSVVDGGRADATFDHWTLVEKRDFQLGDLNLDGLVDVADIDLLSAELRADHPNLHFDLNRDSLVDIDDLTFWIKSISATWFGDSNVDGEFNSNDFVRVFQAGEYEDGLQGNSKWSTGDWNADGEFDSRDLVIAFQDDGFESGPRPAIQSVPEPAPLFVMVTGLIGIISCRRGQT